MSFSNLQQSPCVIAYVLPYSALWSPCEDGLDLYAGECFSIHASNAFVNAPIVVEFVCVVIAGDVGFDDVVPAFIGELVPMFGLLRENRFPVFLIELISAVVEVRVQDALC